MPRKPTDFGSTVDAEIVARTERGESSETIAHALGMPKQVRTIRRRQAQLKGKVSLAKVSPSRPRVEVASDREPRLGSREVPENEAPEAVEVPDDVPEGTPLEQVDRWIRKLERAEKKADAQGNMNALASLSQKAVALIALRERLKPLPKIDPNEAPDMKALAEQGRARLHALIHDLFHPK